MNATDHLTKHGIKPRLKPNGKIGLQGMDGVPEAMKNELVAWAKNHRDEILKELTGAQKGQKAQKGFESAPLKIMPMGELQKPQKGFETENIPTSPTAKTTKTPFYTFCSDRGRRFSEKQDPAPEAPPAPLKIMPMTVCLDGKKCRHLDAPGDRRPICSKTGAPVFDMTACPLGKWAAQQPKPINERSIT